MTHYSGLEILVIRSDSNFQMIRERTNVTGSTKFRNLIEADDYDAAFRNCLSRLSQTIGPFADRLVVSSRET